MDVLNQFFEYTSDSQLKGHMHMTEFSVGVDVFVCVFGPTSKDGAELGPAGYPPLRGVLTERHLQEKHRQPTSEKEDEVGDEECTLEKNREIMSK